VRKISFGEGVERTFALYSPIVNSIKVIRSGEVRRAKLYYLRDRTGKSARIAEKIRKNIGIDIEVKQENINTPVEADERVAVENKAQEINKTTEEKEDSKKEETLKKDEGSSEKK